MESNSIENRMDEALENPGELKNPKDIEVEEKGVSVNI